MAQATGDIDEGEELPPARSRRRLRRALAIAVLIVVAAFAALWFSRERIAGSIIADQLAPYDIPATYDIARISPGRQVLTNIVIGDPKAPDMTVERAEVAILYRLGRPRIGRVTLVRPRLFGTWRGGRLSFGSLDRALFRDTGEPPGLPEIDLALIDARALVESDWGPIGVKAEGAGQVDDGFEGIIAVAAPRLQNGECTAQGVSLYGQAVSSGGKPTFTGPVRVARLDCPAQSSGLRGAAFRVAATGDADLRGVEGEGRLTTGSLAASGLFANGLTGTVRAAWRRQALTGRYLLAARGLAHRQLSAAIVTAEGTVRGRKGMESFEIEADVESNGLRIGRGLDAGLAHIVSGARGTLIAPLVAQARGALARESRASELSASITARRSPAGTTILIPQANLRGGSGATLLALSRGQFTQSPRGGARFLGNVATGGDGLPRIVGRIERSRTGRSIVRLRMAEYRAGTNALAIPDLVLTQADSGAVGFAGRIAASGALPGGSARGLRVPVDGSWSSTGGLAMWRRCTTIAFDRLAVASLTLDGRMLTLCPGRAAPIVAQNGRGLRIAAGAPSLALSGRLGETPIRLRSGPVGLAYPGVLSARAVDVALGPPATASTFRISDLSATFGREIAGKFAGADVRLFAVPLNLDEASGNWRYRDGTLSIADGTFRLLDRSPNPRFNPLVSEGGDLTLRDNIIRANATMREPVTRRLVTEVAIVHNLASGAGSADLTVPGVLFDRQLQPETLFPLARGVIANARGEVRGTGRVVWDARGVTSRGSFSSDNLDFAAAFGPVRGASGTVEFTDLLGLTTAPDQRLRVASVNPGIEVTEGEVLFSLSGGQLLAVSGARWPFMGGTLTLRSTSLNLGTSEERRYVFEIEGLEAAQFVERMELPNISATGTFDGTLPIVFDTSGNGRIEGGLLIARSPGGNVSYVGELTREDLGLMANFAFDALRSLDYKQMSIAMDGNLTGEIVTRVRFDGVKQGAGAKRNFITKRFENLPIRFNINIRAPFYQLITSLKAMYDPASVRDPRAVGLLDAEGRVLQRQINPAPPAIRPEDLIPDTLPIQTSESENRP